MATKICSLCGETYTDEEGHNYDKCVERCRDRVSILKGKLQAAQGHLEEAQRIQKQDWWRNKK
jgi:hypothetical protein